MMPNYSAEEEATAFHEVGHAIVGAVRDRPPLWVTVIAADGASGKTEFPENSLDEYKRVQNYSPEKRCYIETRILTVVAGTIAHDLHCPDRAHDAGDECDDRRACAFIAESAGWASDDRNGYFLRLQERARGLLQTNWPWVEAVARALIEHKTLQREGGHGVAPSLATSRRMTFSIALFRPAHSPETGEDSRIVS